MSNKKHDMSEWGNSLANSTKDPGKSGGVGSLGSRQTYLKVATGESHLNSYKIPTNSHKFHWSDK